MGGRGGAPSTEASTHAGEEPVGCHALVRLRRLRIRLGPLKLQFKPILWPRGAGDDPRLRGSGFSALPLWKLLASPRSTTKVLETN